MTTVTALLDTIDRKKVAVLNDLVEQDGIAEERFTYEEAVALWEAGWQELFVGDTVGKERHEPGQADCETRPDAAVFQSRAESPQLWHITLGVFLHQLHTIFPALPGVLAGAELQDVEEE